MFCSCSRDFMTFAGISTHSTSPEVPKPPTKAIETDFADFAHFPLRPPRLLSFLFSFFFFNIPPLNEIYFSICYSCSLYVCGVSGLPESEMGRPSFLLPPSIATLLASLSARHRRLRLKHFELCAWQTLRKHKKTNKWQGRTKCRHTRYPWRSEKLAVRCD